jgi:hypothetical protein
VIWALHVPECAAGRQKCHSAAALIQKDPMMDTRSTSSQITFRRPFRLNGVDGLQPAGSYTLTVEEERLDTLSFDAWRRTSATLYVPQGGAIDHAAISMEELQAALARDASPEPDTSVEPPHVEPGMARKREILHYLANRS